MGAFPPKVCVLVSLIRAVLLDGTPSLVSIKTVPTSRRQAYLTQARQISGQEEASLWTNKQTTCFNFNSFIHRSFQWKMSRIFLLTDKFRDRTRVFSGNRLFRMQRQFQAVEVHTFCRCNTLRASLRTKRDISCYFQTGGVWMWRRRSQVGTKRTFHGYCSCQKTRGARFQPIDKKAGPKVENNTC